MTLTDPELSETGTGPTVLLLHPLGVDRTVWGPVARRLDGFRVLSYDLPGHGSAPVPTRSLLVGDLADQAAGVLGREPGPAHVVGVSLGGLVGLDLAARHPERVRSLVVVDAVARYPDAMRQMWRERAQLVREEGMEPVVGPTLDLWFTARARSARTPVVEEVEALLRAADPEGYARACELLAEADTRELLPRITAPTLVVCGDDDAPPFTAAAPVLAGSVANGRLAWLLGARHAGALEQPEATADLVRAFLDGVSP